MNIKSRLKKLENEVIDDYETEPVEAKPCEHPPSMFHFYRVYPPKQYADRRLITKGHCNACGFDDYLWSFNNLTEEQENRRYDLRGDCFAGWAYDVELVNAGLIKYALFPPPAEVQMKFTGKVTI